MKGCSSNYKGRKCGKHSSEHAYFIHKHKGYSVHIKKRIERIMRIEFERDGTIQRGKVVATIVEEKDVNIRTTVQVIRFVVILKDGTFTSVPINDCRKARSWWRKLF